MLIISLLGCNSASVREIAVYNQRPHVDVKPCFSNGDGTCWEDNELRNTTGMQCGDVIILDDLLRHLENMEQYRWRCLKFGKCK